MKSKKLRDFATKKIRVGREQFRKHESKDAKLLANIGHLKKTVKLTTQSIAVNKDSLNVTSRRLTLAELIGKARHVSDKVRHHALLGILEFTRRFLDDTLLNLYSIVQVAASSLINQTASVRKQGRSLLLSVIANHLSSIDGDGNKCAECLMLHLIQALLMSDKSVREDAYQVIVSILSKVPSILVGYVDQLLHKVLKNKPDVPSDRHINCIYALSKYTGDVDPHSKAELLDFLYTIIEYGINKGKSETTELGCLSTTSMVVKSFKLVLRNISGVKPDDMKLVQCLMYCDIFEYEALTERGKQTFDNLFAEFVLTKAEIAIKIMGIYTKYQLVLISPLIHLHTLRNDIIATHADKVAAVVLAALSVDITAFPAHSMSNLKPQWRQNLYRMLSLDEPIFDELCHVLQNDIASVKTKPGTFSALERHADNSDTHTEHIWINDIVIRLCRDLAMTLSNSMEILPIIALSNGVSPLICIKEFSRGDHIRQGYTFLEEVPVHFEATFNLELDSAEILESFVSSGVSKSQSKLLLKTMLYISKQPSHIIAPHLLKSYLQLNRIRELSDEELCLIARIILNCEPSTDIVDLIGELFKTKLVDNTVCSLKGVTELMNGRLFHIFRLAQTHDHMAGIDEHLTPLNRVVDCIASVAHELERNLSEDSVDLIELVLKQCVNATMDSLLRSHTNNVWLVSEGRTIIMKRCVEPVCERLVGEGYWNTVLCIANSALAPLQPTELEPMSPNKQNGLEADRSAFLGSETAKRSSWIDKLQSPIALKNYSAIIVNRLPAAVGVVAAIEYLCNSITRILM